MSEQKGKTRGLNMLWLDDEPSPLADKVRRAAAYYQNKYGRPASRCRVNPADLHAAGQYTEKVDDVSILPDVRIPKGHLWIAPSE